MTQRREFIGQLAATAVGLKGGVLATSGKRTPSPDAWDDSWTKHLGKEHKFVLEIAQTTNAQGVYGQVNQLYDDYHTAINTKDEDMHIVLVIRHAAIALAMNDALWTKYSAGSTNGSKDTIAGLQKRGVTVLACNMAAMNRARQWATETKQEEKVVAEEVRSNMLTGVTLQPNGIYAVARAMDMGCVFFHAG